MFKTTLLLLAATLVAPLLVACPKELPPKERFEYRRFEVPEREHEKQARIQAMQASIKGMKSAMIRDVQRKCTVDADCGIVREHCCSCNEGGKRVGIAMSHKFSVAESRLIKCKKVICPQRVSESPTCDREAKAVCNNGMCEVAGQGAAKLPASVPTEPITP